MTAEPRWRFAFLMAFLLARSPTWAAEPVTVLRQGDPAPYTGILAPADTWRDMLHAQDERDAAAERLQLERDEHAIRLRACELRSDARERARAQCEVSRVPPAVEPPWSGWPWLSGAVGVVVGAGLTILVVEAVR